MKTTALFAGYNDSTVVQMAESLGFKVENITPYSLFSFKINQNGTFDEGVDDKRTLYFGYFHFSIRAILATVNTVQILGPIKGGLWNYIRILDGDKNILNPSCPIFAFNTIESNLSNNGLNGSVSFNGFKLIVSR